MAPPINDTTRGGGSMNYFQDDASLPVASSLIRFRATATTSRVYPDDNGQFIITEEYNADGNRTATAKRVDTITPSLRTLRASYTLVAVFFTGFLFVFSLELLLYLVLDLTIEVGLTNKGDLHLFQALGAMLAFPLYVHGLACALVIATQFVIDAYTGHVLVKRFVLGSFSGVLTEWVLFVLFVLIPSFVGLVTLFAGMPNWWEITSLTWFCAVCISYIIFAITIVVFENKACWEVTRNLSSEDDDSWLQVLRRSILLRMRHHYGGTSYTTYLAQGAVNDDHTDDRLANRDVHLREDTHRDQSSWYSKFVRLKCWSTEGGLGLFEELDEPIPQHTLADVRGERPYVTAATWSLEAIYCRPNEARYVVVLKGPDALTRSQMRSNLVCALLANLIITLLVGGALAWLGLPSVGILIALALFVYFGLYPGMKNSYRIYLMTKDLLVAKSNIAAQHQNEDKSEFAPEEAIEVEAEDGLEDDITPNSPTNGAVVLDDSESEGLFQVWERLRVTNVTERMCWILFGLEFFFLFFWPVIALYDIGNLATATLFCFIALFSSLRTYFNAAIVLEETGRLDLVDGEKGSREHWQNMSRLSTIVSRITRSNARGIWMGILCFFLISFLALCGIAVTQTEDTTSDFEFTMLPDFEYKQEADLVYPTCSFGKGLDALGSPTTDMADYAFLATLAYRDPNITQSQLDKWFGNGTAVDNQEYVDAYRYEAETIKQGFLSAVSYKMITFPASGNLAMLCIRGTVTAWDALTDAQLWAAAGLFQGLRLLLPLGNLWTPIIHNMVYVVSWLASDSINKVAFYRQTTSFVKYLQAQKNTYGNIQVTGHSLGGGLSIITGAQTGVAAVALSGPNAMLSRDSFDPPLSPDAINDRTFNIIPNRDIVPRLDDKGILNQAIECTAPYNDFVGCHDGRRSLCEIIFKCGTKLRPALCDCVTEFKYPEPTPKENTTRTFAEACAELIAASK